MPRAWQTCQRTSKIIAHVYKDAKTMERYEEEGVLVIHNMPPQEELANMIGSGREMVNKVIRQLVFGGYILITNKTCKIIKKLPKKYGP